MVMGDDAAIERFAPTNENRRNCGVFSCFSYTLATSGNLKQLGEILKPEQWQRLIHRLGEIPNPKVPAKPSAASLPAKGKQPSGD
jgi:hypothetical protein